MNIPPLKVLLVEDDWSVRSAVRDYLEKHEFLITEASSSHSALELAGEVLPDVAVIDIVLPEEDGGRANFNQDTGIMLARRLREHIPQVGVVFLSAYFDRGPEVARMFMDGHDRIVYLLKGVPPSGTVQRHPEGCSGGRRIGDCQWSSGAKQKPLRSDT
jgi:CheY-like chemotaxis protein